MKDKKAKVLYLITGLYTGGAEVILYRLLRGLDKKKYNPVVVSIVPIGEIGGRMVQEGFHVFSLNAKFKFDPLIFLRLISLIKRENPDIIHAHLFHAIFLGRIAGKLSGVPLIISTVHNINIGSKIREKLSKWTDRFSTVNTVICKSAAEQMTRERISSSKKLKVIYNGIDSKRFQSKANGSAGKIREDLSIKPNQPLLVSVGRLHKQKGYFYLIKAIEKLKQKYPNLVLIILGEGGKREELERQIKKSNLEKKVLLLGNKDNVSDYLNAADLFVMSSSWEGLSVALLEAASSALPIIATDVGGNSEIVENNETGFLVEPKSPDALAEKIDHVLSLSSKEKERICKRAREIVKHKFSLDKMVKGYENLYEEYYLSEL